MKYKKIGLGNINYPIKGYGRKMADDFQNDFPRDWRPVVFLDSSDGFRDKMQEIYRYLEWIKDPF
jgi:hypothetical protein